MVVSEGLGVVTRFKVGGVWGMLPQEKLNSQNFILDILADHLHYYRSCHHNTRIQIEINKT